MSADKDRGIRREKQKRSKELKRQAREQRAPATGAPRTAARAAPKSPVA